MKKFVSLLAAGSLALTLAACGGSGGEAETNIAPIETNIEDLGPTENIMENVVVPEPTPSPTLTPVPAPGPKEFDTSVTEDDAAATGMTSRVDRSGGNSTAPTQ